MPASGPQLSESGERPWHDRLVAFRLDPGTDQLDVPPAGVSRIREGSADARQWNVAVADHDTLAGRHGPGGKVADLHEGDAITSLPDVRVQPPLAPGIVQLEHHPQPGRADVVHEVEGVGEGVQE